MVTIFFLFLQLSSALDFSFDAPDSVQIDESFDVTINSESQDVVDVKIFVHKSESDKVVKSDYISEVNNDGWKDSWYYIKEAFPKVKTFQVKVLTDAGDRKICVRLRKAGTDSTSIKCESISVSLSERKKQSEEEKQTENREEASIEDIKKEAFTTEESTNLTILKEEIIQSNASEEKPLEKIVLKNQNYPTKEISTKKSSSVKLVLYSAGLLVVFLLVLLLLKRI